MSTSALDTPPSSEIEASANLPPSPPLSPPKRASLSAVDQLIGTLKLHRRGKLNTSCDWLAFSLSRSEYQQFEGRLQKEPVLRDWYREKVRYDWDSEEERLVLRMPTALHERFTACVEDAIGIAIDDAVKDLEESGNEQDGRIAAELRKIYKGRSTTLELKVPRLESSSQESEGTDAGDKAVRRSPDATFYHPSQPEYPTLVVEVSYSQQQKDLPLLAESYIIDSSHAICAVVGFKIPYLPPNTYSSPKAESAELSDKKMATFSMWRPGLEYTGAEAADGTREAVGVCSQVKKDFIFRAPAGFGIDSTLYLQLSDVLPRTLPLFNTVPRSRPVASITIPLQPLVDLLNEAEKARPASQEAKQEIKSATSSAPTKFRKRKRTPSEELSDGREETFLQQEIRELEKDAAVDGEYVERPRR